MILLKKINKVSQSDIFTFHSNVLIKDSQEVYNFNKSILFNFNILATKNYFYQGYFCEIFKEKILVRNENFQIIKEIIHNDSYAIKFFNSTENYLIYWKNNNKNKISYFKKDLKIKDDDKGLDLILNERLRLHFVENEYIDPKYFRCSDIVNENYLWEYTSNCDEVVNTNSFIVYTNRLIFFTSKESDNYLPDIFIVILDIDSGNQIMKIPASSIGPGSFDNIKGQFINVQGTNLNNEVIKKYSIIDVNTGIVDTGDLNYESELHSVGSAVQYLKDNKLYFVDNINDYNDQTFNVPKIGSFNVETKRIDFIQEIPEAKGLRLDQIIYNDNKIYVRSSDNQLFIFEK